MSKRIDQLHRIHDAVHMGALHTMGGVNTRADERGAGIPAAAPQGGGVRGVAGIDVHGVVKAVILGQIDQPCHHPVVIGTAAVLGTDGDLVLGAG